MEIHRNVEILWASVREPYNYLQAKQLGCHIITIPPSIIEKIESKIVKNGPREPKRAKVGKQGLWPRKCRPF